MERTLQDWWENGKENRAWCLFKTHTGLLQVYARRSIFDRSVIEIANIGSIEGFGIRTLYRDWLKDIPAISEQIINPDLDKLLERLGWTHTYRDLADIPTRINPAFMARFPRYAEAQNAHHAIRLD